KSKSHISRKMRPNVPPPYQRLSTISTTQFFADNSPSVGFPLDGNEPFLRWSVNGVGVGALPSFHCPWTLHFGREGS
ncbi:unnamed protein product, partial [Nesidiocoris tenuis]